MESKWTVQQSSAGHTSCLCPYYDFHHRRIRHCPCSANSDEPCAEWTNLKTSLISFTFYYDQFFEYNRFCKCDCNHRWFTIRSYWTSPLWWHIEIKHTCNSLCVWCKCTIYPSCRNRFISVPYQTVRVCYFALKILLGPSDRPTSWSNVVEMGS